MRRAEHCQVLEPREIDLAHEQGHHVAHHEAEEHRQLLGGALHQQLERQAGNQGDQTEGQILPTAEILGAGATAE